jgi:hypothetical protein
MADKMSIDKADPTQHQNNNNHLNGLNGHSREETDSLVGSSPEGDHHPTITSASNPTQEPQQPKRKGGRKPVSLDSLSFSLTIYHLVVFFVYQKRAHAQTP